jgi:transcriptional regulator with XRE-family HTH domain
MMTGQSGQVAIPALAWRRPEVGDALRGRDIAALLRLAQQHTGASQSRLALACSVNQSRMNEIINGRREVRSLEVIERIAAGLAMPDEARMLLGLSPTGDRLAATAEDLSGRPGPIARSFIAQADAAGEIRSAAMHSTGIDLLVVRGLGILGLTGSLLRTTMTRPRAHTLTVRILLLGPTSDAAQRRAQEIGESTQTFIAGIELAKH